MPNADRVKVMECYATSDNGTNLSRKDTGNMGTFWRASQGYLNPGILLAQALQRAYKGATYTHSDVACLLSLADES